MRSLLIFLITLSLSSISVFSEHSEDLESGLNVPSDEFLLDFIKKHPEETVKMLKKLYILENSIPEIIFPELYIIENVDGSVILDYNDSLSIRIGTNDNNLLYSIDLNPVDVTVARRECDEFPWGWVIGLPIGTLLIGFTTGILIRGF